MHEWHSMCRRRPFTEGDCKTKFRALFPPESDTNAAIAHLSDLKCKWKLWYYLDVAQGGPDGQQPTVTNIYIIWPWTMYTLTVNLLLLVNNCVHNCHDWACLFIMLTMQVLAPSFFCDATFHMTVYDYKLIHMTTLDGEKQHRPLFTAYISTSDTLTWKKICNFFHMSVTPIPILLIMSSIVCVCDD